jgi:FkbM family methyltransferase
MLRRLMAWYGRLPAPVQARLRHWVVMPGKRLASHGIIQQPGFKMARALHQSIAFQLARTGEYEPALTALLRAWLRPGDTCLDVGANIGYFTLLAAARVGPAGQVHSFEPHPRTFRDLRRNVALNRFAHVRLNNLAVNHDGRPVQLWYGPEIDSGLASLRPGHALLTHHVACPAITLDAYAAQLALGPVRALKLDIEGAEWLALQGARRLLSGPQRPDLIALEVIRAHLQEFGISAAALVDDLRGQAYTLYELVAAPGGYHLMPLAGSGAGLGAATLVALARQPEPA